MTNGDKIRKMSNEELSEMLSGNCAYCIWHLQIEGKCGSDCEEGIKAYLDMEEE